VRNAYEEIVYWYLRLNNFFLIENFVLHVEHGGDHDLLALRPVGAVEKIGEKELMTEENKFRKCFKNKGQKEKTFALGLIVQVKGGKYSDANGVNKAFSKDKLKPALFRFGVGGADAEGAAETLSEGESYTSPAGLTVCTLLAKRRDVEHGGKAVIPLNLEDMLKFLKSRAGEGAEDHRKSRRDWLFFPGGMFQHLLVERLLQSGGPNG